MGACGPLPGLDLLRRVGHFGACLAAIVCARLCLWGFCHEQQKIGALGRLDATAASRGSNCQLDVKRACDAEQGGQIWVAVFRGLL